MIHRSQLAREVAIRGVVTVQVWLMAMTVLRGWGREDLAKRALIESFFVYSIVALFFALVLFLGVQLSVNVLSSAPKLGWIPWSREPRSILPARHRIVIGAFVVGVFVLGAVGIFATQADPWAFVTLAWFGVYVLAMTFATCRWGGEDVDRG